MTPKRAAVYFGCSATLLAAWLASASGLSNQSAPPAVEPQPVQSTGTETLAEDVQAQAQRLRDRLAAAPVPQSPARNPFSFAPKQARARVAAAIHTPVAPQVQVFPEPVLSLVGIAADQSPAGPVRTAIITAEGGEMFMVKAGGFIGARYRVESVGADAVELSDLTNGSIRRLALR